MNMNLAPAAHFRTIWISDLHIGTPECKIELLIDFLERNSCEKLYLVGDIVDLRYISQSRRWIRSHEKALLKLAGLIKQTHIVLIPGNHDRVLRILPEMDAPNVGFAHEVLHTTADGKTLLVIHGDLADARIRTETPEWKIDLVCFFYYRLLRLQHWRNMMRLRAGASLRRYVGAVKDRLAFWKRYRASYEAAILAEAATRPVDGVVCGHIHAPCLELRAGMIYANTGDWVENCTALVERHDGRLHLARWDRFGLPPLAEQLAD